MRDLFDLLLAGPKLGDALALTLTNGHQEMGAPLKSRQRLDLPLLHSRAHVLLRADGRSHAVHGVARGRGPLDARMKELPRLRRAGIEQLVVTMHCPRVGCDFAGVLSRPAGW